MENNIVNDLGKLRMLRHRQFGAQEKADECQRRAMQGMSRQRATDTGGTGHCPLTDYADAHIAARKRYHEAKKEADAIWEKIKPLLDGEGFDEQQVIDLSYNQAYDFLDVCRALKRSRESVMKMLHNVTERMAMKDS